MSAAIPVHLVCGFLGAGKTTLLRRLLAEQPREERLAVLVNEFGRLGIDGRLLQGFSARVRELRAGCICCELRVDFQRALAELVERFAPGRILVEATGLAGAGDLAGAVEEAAARLPVAVGSVVTVVDAELFPRRELFGAAYFDQIAAAELLLLNKTDLVPPEEVEAMAAELGEMNPRARLVPVVHCEVERELVLNPLGGSRPLAPPAGLDLAPRPPAPAEHTGGFREFSFQEPGSFDPECLLEWLAALPWRCLRVKGLVSLPAGPHLLNHTYRRPELSPWPGAGQGNRLAFVTWELEPQEVLPGLERCLVS